MKRVWIRSALFNILFFIITAMGCVLFLPSLALPRPAFLAVVRLWHYIVVGLEYAVLGLRYEVRGRENLPKNGAYIAALKHQSPYETLKLRLIFDDPAIVLKKELLKIPLWGTYLKKSGVIAIDRSTPDEAIASIERGAREMMAQGRPIIIFPQGTRVAPGISAQEKPYKVGVARIQEATGLPIIPVALNTGMFWPKGGWLKSSGSVVFEFLPPVQSGLERGALLTILTDQIESASNALMQEALSKQKTKRHSVIVTTLLFIAAFAAYSVLWFNVADQVKKSYISFSQDLAETNRVYTDPVISGFPGPISVKIESDSLSALAGSMQISDILLRGWPIPGTPILIRTGTVTLEQHKWKQPLKFDSLEGDVIYFNDTLTILRSALRRKDFEGGATGKINLKQEPVPDFNVTLTLKNYQSLLQALVESGIMKKKPALFAGIGFTALSDSEGVAHVPLSLHGNTLFAGPLKIAELPATHPSSSVSVMETLPDPAH